MSNKYYKKIKLPSNDELILRIPNINDAQGILNHVNIVSYESNNLAIEPGKFHLSLEDEQTYLKAMNENPLKTMIVGIVQDQIIAVGDIGSPSRPRLKKTAEIAISVQKAYWRKKIGFNLMTALIEWGKNEAGFRKINLSVREDNEAAINLYEKLGFEEEGLVSRGLFIDGKFYGLRIMGLKID